MSIIDNAKEAVKKFILKIALKKGVVSAAKLIVSYAISHGIKLNFPLGGVEIDLQNQAVMIVAINSGLSVARNWAKTKWPDRFGWL